MTVETITQKSFKERIELAIRDLNQGKGIIVVDDFDRENEGDLIFSAENISVNDMALTIRECSGIVCLVLEPQKAKALNLDYMVTNNESKFQTPFTVSIEAKKGVTTGVSAADRITTIRAAITDEARPQDLARPGHVFPLIARPNGVFERRGHTEGSIDIMKIAGLKPVAVLCELMNEDGTMSNFDEISAFANKHNFTVISIDDIYQYRLNNNL